MTILIDKETFAEAVRNSNTYLEVMRKLNWKSSSYRRVKFYIQKWKLDTTHFVGIAWAKGKIYKKSEPIVLCENSTRVPSHIRDYIIRNRILKYVCSDCGLNKWNNKILSLEIDHINGIREDNRIENLRFLCPNCHSLTPTWKGRRSGSSYYRERLNKHIREQVDELEK